jgi:hydrogenase nickel incorporation protein HypA/HybF
MHELSIAHSIIQIAEQNYPPDKQGKITGITLQIGELSSIETEALRFAFEAVKDNTILQHAILDIEVIEGEGRCSECGTVFHMPGFGTPCPQCSSFLVHVQKGREMRVLSLMVDE